MVRNSAQLNQEIAPCEIDSMAILRGSDFAASVCRWGHQHRYGKVLSMSAQAPTTEDRVGSLGANYRYVTASNCYPCVTVGQNWQEGNNG
jgi:hypothetical protein